MSYTLSEGSLAMDINNSAVSRILNEETPPLEVPVAVEWWFDFDEDGEPELDTHHGFHDAEHIADETPPAVQDGEIVNASGTPVDADSERDLVRESRYLYLTHQEALSRNITPCVECFPEYATEQRLIKAREGDGILTEAGVEGAVFPVWTRYDQDSGWDLDSVHNSYTSLLYRARAIREHAGSVGGRLRYSLMPTRRCEYMSFEEAAATEPMMAHVDDLRTVQPEELSDVRDRFGDEFLSTPVEYEHRYTDTADTQPPLVHCAENPPCGYERAALSIVSDDAEEDISELAGPETQTIADVIERGNVVEFCESCFPDLAAWNAGPDN